MEKIVKFGNKYDNPYPSIVRVLRGSFTSGVSFENYAKEKVKKLKKFTKQHENAKTVRVFLGDTGQGDIITGKDGIFGTPKVLNYMLARIVKNEAAIKVDDLADALRFYPSKEEGVYVFRTYIEAAVIAENLGITPEDFDVCEFQKTVIEKLSHDVYKINENQHNNAFWHPEYKNNFNAAKFSASKAEKIKSHFEKIQEKLDACGEYENLEEALL